MFKVVPAKKGLSITPFLTVSAWPTERASERTRTGLCQGHLTGQKPPARNRGR